jgi:hypothetical protein
MLARSAAMILIVDLFNHWEPAWDGEVLYISRCSYARRRSFSFRFTLIPADLSSAILLLLWPRMCYIAVNSAALCLLLSVTIL